MKISIVTVSFNSEKTIRDTIESVLGQSHSSVEYIIIDGQSTDRTMSIVNEYGDRIAKTVSESDNGIYDAMNKGIQIASGDIVGILNSDDVFEADNVLANIVDMFETNPGIDMVFGDIVYSLENDLNKTIRYYSSAHFKPWKLRYGWMPPHPATFVKRSLYLEHGYYSRDYKIAADYEMFVRWLLVKQIRYRRMDAVVARMRAGGVSTSGLKSSLLLNREIVKACTSNGIYTSLFLVLIKLPFKLLELVRRPTPVQ